MLPLLFGGLLIKAVNRAAGFIMAEVRRQLRIPQIMSGKKTPDYAQAVAISTRSAQAKLIPLGLIATWSPIVVGLLLKEQALGGFPVGHYCFSFRPCSWPTQAVPGTTPKNTSQDGYYGGRGSPNHKASVVGDTVGDPFKDTAGPGLNPMIKVMDWSRLFWHRPVVQNEGPEATIPVLIISLIGIALIVGPVRRSHPTVTGRGHSAAHRIGRLIDPSTTE